MRELFRFLLLLLSLSPIPIFAFGPNSVPRPIHQQRPQQSGSRSSSSPWGITTSRSPATTTTTFLVSLDNFLRQIDLSYRLEEEARRERGLPFQHRNPTSLYASSSDYSTSDRPSKPVKIIIAGAPASGKGTQCEKIKERYGVVHLSTGDMLRAAVADKTEVGLQAKEYMDSGRLVPDEVIIGVVKERLKQSDCQEQGWLLDGFPRTQAQAQALVDSGVVADCFLFLNVPDEVLVERVVGRRTDPETGKIYHMTFSPPCEEAVMARLEQRSDDTEEKVKVRLEQFHANVDAVKDSYTKISVSVDGNQAPEMVSEAIFEAIESKLAVQR